MCPELYTVTVPTVFDSIPIVYDSVPTAQMYQHRLIQ